MPHTPSFLTGCYFWSVQQQRDRWMKLPMVECKARTVIKGSATRTLLKQHFVNVNDGDIAKCQYAFPLYDGVSVVSFQCEIGGNVLQGLVKEREQAKRQFDEAVARGESAGLMEQNLSASDVFSTTLGNLPKDSTAIVTIEYVTELKHDLETDSLKFEMPTGIAPRYIGPHTSLFPFLCPYPCDSTRLPHSNGFEWTCDLEMPNIITKVESPTHAVSVSLGQLSTEGDDEPDFKKCSATLSLQNESGLSKELVLRVKTKGIKDPVALWETHPALENQKALMATLVPSFALPQIKPEIVFVCDRSGSMAGQPIEVLVDALRVMLHSLPANGVKFNICSFGSGHSFLFNKSQSYNRETLAQAVQHLSNFDANCGGTETESAIRATIDQRYGDIPLEIILFTDGDIWDQQRMFSYLNDKVAESKQQIRVFPLGIGHGVSTALIEGVARAGNGFASTVMPGERMDQRCMRMLKAALSPHITNYALEVQYEKEENDDFEMIEKIDEAKVPGSSLPSRPKQQEQKEKKTVSLFDSSVDADDVEMADSDINLPDIKAPRILQAPHTIPPLYAFARTTVYLLLGPESTQRIPKSVILKGMLDNTELKLEIPVTSAGTAQTIHQLAARKAIQDLEEGRGWPFVASSEGGELLSKAHPSLFDDLVKKEAVRVGTRFQVMNKWCSYIALDVKNTESSRSNSDAQLLTETDTETKRADPSGMQATYSQRSHKPRNMAPQAQMAPGSALFSSRSRGGATAMGAFGAPPPPPQSASYDPTVSDRVPSSGSLFAGPGTMSSGSFGGTAGGLFGNTTIPTASGLFGSSSGPRTDYTSNQTTGFGCAGARFMSPAPPEPTFGSSGPGSSLFGASQSSVSSASLFGSPAAAPPTTTGHSSFRFSGFGSNRPISTGGSPQVFGPGSTGSGLFGNNSTTPMGSVQSDGVGRLFGNSTTHTPAAGLFDNVGAVNPFSIRSNAAEILPTQSSNLFGASQPQIEDSSAFMSVEAEVDEDDEEDTSEKFTAMSTAKQSSRRRARIQSPFASAAASNGFNGFDSRKAVGPNYTGVPGFTPAGMPAPSSPSFSSLPPPPPPPAPAATAPTPASLPEFSSDAERVRYILGLQEFDGSFEVANAKALAHALGVPKDKVMRDQGESIWLTVLVLSFLEGKMRDEEEIWDMAADKARAWLGEQGVDLNALGAEAKATLA